MQLYVSACSIQTWAHLPKAWDDRCWPALYLQDSLTKSIPLINDLRQRLHCLTEKQVCFGNAVLRKTLYFTAALEETLGKRPINCRALKILVWRLIWNLCNILVKVELEEDLKTRCEEQKALNLYIADEAKSRNEEKVHFSKELCCPLNLIHADGHHLLYPLMFLYR